MSLQGPRLEVRMSNDCKFDFDVDVPEGSRAESGYGDSAHNLVQA